MDQHTQDAAYKMAYEQQMNVGVPADILVVAHSFKSRAVRPASLDSDFERRIIDRTVDFCLKRGIKDIPSIYILDSDIPNAASVSGNHMIITTALLNNMTDTQLDAIIGHELSHHRHSRRDLLAQGAIGFLGAEIASIVWPKRLPLPKQIPGAMKGLLQEQSYVLPYYFGAMLPVAQYRHFMEYEADKEGAQLTSPKDMADALHALQKHKYMMKSEAEEKTASFSKRVINTILFPFGSHPKTEKRIARINAMPDNSVSEPEYHNTVKEQPSVSLA